MKQYSTPKIVIIGREIQENVLGVCKGIGITTETGKWCSCQKELIVNCENICPNCSDYSRS